MERCPLCLKNPVKLFHHWDYEKNIGVGLCEECHVYIHNGLSLKDWPITKVLQRLTYRYLKFRFDSKAEDVWKFKRNYAELASEIKRNLNIPYDDRFVYTHIYTAAKRFPQAPSPYVFRGILTAEKLREPEESG
jgi:hypothetical protein